MKADYRLKCDGPEYEGYVGYASLMILIYPIGIPLFYFICLWLQSSKIQKDTSLMTIDDSRNDDVMKFHEDLQKIMSFSLGHEENQKKILLLRNEIIGDFKVERARKQTDLVMYATLFEAYKPEFFYWECLECVRRLSLTGLLVFMYPGSEKQILLAVMICMLWIILYAWLQPYLNPLNNHLLTSAQWGILLQLYGIFLILNRSFDSSTGTIGWLMIIVGIVCPVSCLALGLRRVKV